MALPTACTLHLFGRPAAMQLQMMSAETVHLHMVNLSGAFKLFGAAAVHGHTYHTLLLNHAQ